MYKICVVANYDSLSRQEYADLRPFLEKKWEVFQYTSKNIGDLHRDLRNNDFDCIIFATSSLNDPEVHNVVTEKNFRRDLEIFLEAGRGLIILHSYLYATRVPKYDFLPLKVGNVLMKLIKDPETCKTVKYQGTGYNDNHQVLNFPNKINLDELYNNALNNQYFKGVYWYYHEIYANDDKVDKKELWDNFIVDEKEGTTRSILLKSKIYNIYIISALLDFQHQYDLLENMIIDSISGGDSYAFVKSSNTIDNQNELFIEETLKANKQFISEYVLFEGDDYSVNKDDVDRLVSNIENSFHSTVVLANDVLSNQIKKIDSLRQSIKANNVRVIELGYDNINDGVRLYGSSNQLLKYQKELIRNAKSEFSKGLAGEFWDTIYILEELLEINQEIIDLESIDMKEVLEEIQIHYEDQGTIYDTTSTTCAMYWLFKHLKFDDIKKMTTTKNWILNGNIDNVGKRDFLYLSRYLAFTEFEGIVNKKVIDETIDSVLDMNNLTENQINNLLYSSLRYKLNDKILQISKYVIDNEILITTHDMRIKAQLIQKLIEILYSLELFDETYKKKAQAIIFSNINPLRIYLREGYEKNRFFANIHEYLAVLNALKKFEENIAYSVDQILNVFNFSEEKNILFNREDQNMELDSLRNINYNLNSELVDSKYENNKLNDTIKNLKKTYDKDTQKLTNLSDVFILITLILLIVLFCVLFYLGSKDIILLDGKEVKVSEIVKDSVFTSWAAAFGLISTLGVAFKQVINRLHLKKK